MSFWFHHAKILIVSNPNFHLNTISFIVMNFINGLFVRRITYISDLKIKFI